MKSFKQTLNESSLSRVYRHSQSHDIGIITAFRDARDCNEGQEYTKRENLQRNKSLKAKLQAKGYGITVVKGSYIENYNTPNAKEVGEQVFLVVDLKDNGSLEKDLRSLGESFEQDSILYSPKGGVEAFLIGTNKCPDGYPGYGKKIKLKNAIFGKGGEFQTRVNGRPFIFKEDVEARNIAEPKGYFGKFGCSVTANKSWDEIELSESELNE